MLKYWILGLTALAISYALTPRVAALARRLGAVAIGDARRIHQGAVPALGGLAVLAALLGALTVGSLSDEYVWAALAARGSSALWLLAGLFLSCGCGAIDDLWPLSPLSKLALQIIAASFVLFAGFGIGGVTNPFSGETILFGWIGIPLTLLWVVGITNAFNLIDGLDGLAAGVGLIAAATLFVISLGSGQVDVAIVSIALAGSLLGFLYFNFHPASVFLGDSGALLLGFLLAVLSIHALQKGATAVVIATPILALGLPIADTLLAMVRRILGAPPDPQSPLHLSRRFRLAAMLEGDRDHIHHRLLALGLTHRRAVLLLYAVCFALNLLAFMAVRARGPDLALLVAVAAIAAALAIRRLGYQAPASSLETAVPTAVALPVLNRVALRAVLDAGLVATAFGTALAATSDADILAVPLRAQMLFAVVMVTAIKVAVFVVAGIYRGTANGAEPVSSRTYASTLGAAEIAMLAAVWLITPVSLTPLLAVLDGLLSSALLVITRQSLRLR